jgi:peptidoglycan hydrolase-like protein with peptidoglycan-binding domain
MKKTVFLYILLFFANYIFSQDFSRIIELRSIRMYGNDIVQLQTLLKNMGFDEIGEIDGYYGPLTENAINTIQYFSGFENDGKVNKILWDFLFNKSNSIIIKNINVISKYNKDNFTVLSEQNIESIRSTEGNRVNKYYQNNILKMSEVNIAGEMGQSEYNFYLIDINNSFLRIKNYMYAEHIFSYLNKNPETDEYVFDEEGWKKGLTITYESFLKIGNEYYKIIDGNLKKKNTMEWLFNIIENK